MKNEKTVQELIGEQKRFLVPRYQRGYRWKRVNVLDLLNDLYDFMHSDKEVYSLQPLVVYKAEDNYYHVVDGQQRLTTISILLHYLGQQQIPITYETRKDTQRNYYVAYDAEEEMQEEGVDQSLKQFNNIDQYHVNQAYKAIAQWFGGAIEKKKEFIELLKDQNSKRVKFIWYCTTDDEVATFIRMNKGKIALTNAELIKALLLKKGNFAGDQDLLQKRMAAEWHNMEALFNDDAFWRFLRPMTDNRATRMDFLFDIVKKQNLLNFKSTNDVGTDGYATFRYFYQYFNASQADAFQNIREQVLKVFNILAHWYNDIDMYHYVGFLLVSNPGKIHDLLACWLTAGMTADGFKHELRKEINAVISDSGCNHLSRQYKYNTDENPDKTKCVSVLLLFNIQRMVLLNRSLSKKANTQHFTKFPFHLYKKEKWNVEHIASATDNDLSKPEDQKAWLKTFLFDPMVTKNIKQEIKDFIEKPDKNKFNNLYDQLEKAETTEHENEKYQASGEQLETTETLLNEKEKNQIWNFCLLDEHTNKSYGNAIFPVKRKILLGKTLGKQYALNNQLEVVTKQHAATYVPACTKDVFAKTFSTEYTSGRAWTKADANDYRQAIFECLSVDFEVYKDEEK